MKRFAFALLAAIAFAQDGDETVTDETVTDETTTDEVVEEEVIVSWTGDVAWDADLVAAGETGVMDMTGDADWSKKFKAGTADAAAVGLPTNVLAEPNADGVNWIWVTSAGTWSVKWEDKTDKNAKAHVGNIAMSWIAAYTGDEADPESIVVTAVENTGGSCDKSSGSMVCTDLWSNTTDACDDGDWSKNGQDTCGVILDAAVTAWSGSVAATVADGLVTGMTLTANRPWVPTDDLTSAIEFKNQQPEYMCMAIWVTREDVAGAAELQCGGVMIDIPVPDPEPEPEVTDPECAEGDDTCSGASALYATALAFAAVAAMAF